MNILRTGTVLLCALLLSTSCEKRGTGPEYQKEITVFGYLWGNQSADSTHAILVAYTEPVVQPYSLAQAGIRGALVSVTETATGRRTVLHDTPRRPGFYFNDSLAVRPKTIYRLSVFVEGREVTASTTVPSELRINTALRHDTVNVVRQQQLSKTTPVFLDGESADQIVLVEMFCNETFENAVYVNPFNDKHTKPRDRDEYDGGNNGPPRRILGVARLKELVSPDFPDNRTVIDWYSSMIVFLGSNTLTVMAIDGNYHHYLTGEHPELMGGVQGGIGVFGSVCGEKFPLRVVK